MKVWGTLVLAVLVSGCAGARRPEAPISGDSGGKELVDRLRVEREYRPMHQGTQAPGAFLSLPTGAYVASGWAACCSIWPCCEHSLGASHRRSYCAGCRRSPCCCD